MRTDRTSTPSENQAKARSDVRLSPNSDGREINVDCGSGSPEQIVRCTNGTVQHDVASTEVCMNSAKPSVLTARYRPRMRRAVSPTSTDTTRGRPRPAEGEQQDEGDPAAEVGGDVRPHRHQPELAQRDLARPPGEDRQRQGDHAVDADLGHEERATHVEHEREQGGDDHHGAARRPCPTRFRSRSPRWRKPRVPVVHDERSAVREPLLQRRGPHEQGQLQQHEEDQLDGGGPRRRVGDVPLEQVLHDAHADAGRRRRRAGSPCRRAARPAAPAGGGRG